MKSPWLFEPLLVAVGSPATTPGSSGVLIIDPVGAAGTAVTIGTALGVPPAAPGPATFIIVDPVGAPCITVMGATHTGSPATAAGFPVFIIVDPVGAVCAAIIRNLKIEILLVILINNQFISGMIKGFLNILGDST